MQQTVDRVAGTYIKATITFLVLGMLGAIALGLLFTSL